MNCKNFRIRSKEYEKYFYCNFLKKKITREKCSNCKRKEYKQQKKIRTKSKKQTKLERNRFSILQKDDGYCFVCERACKKLDAHEAFGGCNRKKSIEHGLVYYLCRICHDRADLDRELRRELHNYARKRFIEEHSKEEFLKEFKNNYL